MKTMFGQMPSAKELVDHMANVEAFLQDAKAARPLMSPVPQERAVESA